MARKNCKCPRGADRVGKGKTKGCMARKKVKGCMRYVRVKMVGC
jgi:hypothetical protein